MGVWTSLDSTPYASGSYIDDVTYIHGDAFKRRTNVQTETTCLLERKEDGRDSHTLGVD
jgi:hypothetical protein